MRKFYWYFTGFMSKHGWKIVLSVIGGIIVFSVLVPLAMSTFKWTSKRYVGIIGSYTTTTLPDEIQRQLSAGLTTIAEDGSAVGALADRWTIEQENKTYRFQLKKNLLWQDGTLITPEEVNYVFPETPVITTPNDVIFRLPAAFSPFPTLVEKPIFKSGTRKKWFFWNEPTVIGVGEYRLSGYKLNGTRLKELTTENDKERVIYRFYKTEQDAVNAFKQGEIDELPDLVKEFDVMSWNNVTTTPRTDYWKYIACFFNVRDPLMSKNVRQALSYALTKTEGEMRATGPISPLSWAYLPGGKTYGKDWERGKERLLEEAPGTTMALTLTTTSEYQERAEAIKREWEAFGAYVSAACQKDSAIKDKTICERVQIAVTIRVQAVPDTSNYQLLLIGYGIDPDPDQYAMWHSDQPTNITGYKNTRIDSLLEKAGQTTNQAERKQLYQEFQQFLLEDPPAIFLEYFKRYEVKRAPLLAKK